MTILKYLLLLLCSFLSRGTADFVISQDSENVFLSSHILAESSVEQTFATTSICKCESICASLESCSTASFSTSGGSSKCLISSLPLHDVHMKSVEGGFTVAKVSAFKFFFGEDGWFYTLYRGAVSNSDIKKKCETLVNGRMVVLNTPAQITSFRKFYEMEINPPDGGRSWFNLGLVMNATGSYWVDGSPFDAPMCQENALVVHVHNELEKIGSAAFYYKDFFIIKGNDLGSWPMCQFRPF